MKLKSEFNGNLVQNLEGRSGYVISVCFNHDGSQVASGTEDNTVKAWNTNTGQIHTLEGHDDEHHDQGEKGCGADEVVEGGNVHDDSDGGRRHGMQPDHLF